MTESRDPVAVLERVRELENEIASLVSGLDPDSAQRKEDVEFTVLEIRVGDSIYLIPIDQVREVVPMAWPEPIPGAPDWVMGTISFGSEPTTLIDMALRLHGRPTKLSDDLFVVVFEHSRWIGLVVSMVGDLREIKPAELTTPGSGLPCADFLLGTVSEDDGQPLSVLSVRRLGHGIDG